MPMDLAPPQKEAEEEQAQHLEVPHSRDELPHSLHRALPQKTEDFPVGAGIPEPGGEVVGAYPYGRGLVPPCVVQGG